jgi:hypothetical protein
MQKDNKSIKLPANVFVPVRENMTDIQYEEDIDFLTPRLKDGRWKKLTIRQLSDYYLKDDNGQLPNTGSKGS